MSDAEDLIEELARHVETGETLDFGKILEIHARIERLHESLEADSGEKGQDVRAAREADLLIEKIMRQYVGNTSAALGGLGQIVATMPQS
jgi:hypothetical protein